MRNPNGLDCDLFVSDWVVFDGSPVRNSADLSCGCAAERKVEESVLRAQEAELVYVFQTLRSCMAGRHF